jgi:hypothetical protein
MTKTTTGHAVERIQIAGGDVFYGDRWRDAILAYLNGIWAGDVAVTHRPKISFNNTVLRVGRDGKYVGYFVCEPDSGDRPFVADKDVLVVPDPTEAEVENALIRFVKNNQIRQLGIVFSTDQELRGNLVLTKGRKRSELFVATGGSFQSQEQYMRVIGYQV